MRALAAVACILSTAIVIVLALAAYRAGDGWGAFSFGSLLLLLIFGPSLRRQPAAPRKPTPLDPWLRPDVEG